MPRKGLREKYVQDKAIEYLKVRYKTTSETAVAGLREATIRKDCKHGRGRADGLIVVLEGDSNLRTIVIEAKSQRTLKEFRTEYENKKLLIHTLIVALLIGITGSLITFYLDLGLIGLISAISAVTIIAAMWWVLQANQPSYTRVSVIDQVKRYPANERWIAISSDAYNKYDREDKTGLRRDCEREGIGLLRVSVRGVEELEIPTSIRRSWKPYRRPVQYLDSYCQADDLRRELSSK